MKYFVVPGITENTKGERFFAALLLRMTEGVRLLLGMTGVVEDYRNGVILSESKNLGVRKNLRRTYNDSDVYAITFMK